VLGELIGTTTHEFNNVLMTIINYAKLGLRNTDTATRTNALQKILDAGERAAKITRSILAVSRNRNGEFEPTDLGSLVSDVLILMEREFRKYRVKVDFSVSSTALVRGIPSQLQQVILNMLVNARQAMLDGGEVQIRIQQDTHADCVSLSIRDSGQGIAQDQLSRIFEPYYSTKAGPDATGRGGTGLGLSACREIIRAHRGRIRVESTVGRGTCFTIRLPVWQNTEGAPQVSVSD
jgi:signal transduction histidine kinase